MWELWRSLRYGSEFIVYRQTREECLAMASEDIANNGGVGKITFVDDEKRIVYYSEFPEED